MGLVKSLLFADKASSNFPSSAFAPRLPYGKIEFSDKWLKEAETYDQLAAMREWFEERYCDPAIEMPYDGNNGGYQFIYGGPFHPSDVLRGRFSGVVDETVIDELARGLVQRVGNDWAPVSSFAEEDFFDIEEYGPLSTSDPYETLKIRLIELNKILELKGDPPTELLASKMVFAAGFSALESYLFETMVVWTYRDEKVVNNIVSNVKSMKEKKLTLKELIGRENVIQEEALKFLKHMVWHRFDNVSEIYRVAFKAEFPDSSKVERFLNARHDIVHRSGSNDDGWPIQITGKEVYELFNAIDEFSANIQAMLPAK